MECLVTAGSDCNLCVVHCRILQCHGYLNCFVVLAWGTWLSSIEKTRWWLDLCATLHSTSCSLVICFDQLSVCRNMLWSVLICEHIDWCMITLHATAQCNTDYARVDLFYILLIMKDDLRLRVLKIVLLTIILVTVIAVLNNVNNK